MLDLLTGFIYTSIKTNFNNYTKTCRGNHASICLRWLKLNQFLTLSSLPITIEQVLWWEYFSDVKLRYVSLLNCYSLMAIWSVGLDWRSLWSLLPIIGDLCCFYCLGLAIFVVFIAYNYSESVWSSSFFGDIQTDK